MKCVKSNTGGVFRVTDTEAKLLVESGQAVYCGKEEYKAQRQKAAPAPAEGSE